VILGVLTSFDITPDGKAIVFDRSLQNSNIVLIERAAEIIWLRDLI